jgi:hypothetical protein
MDLHFGQAIFLLFVAGIAGALNALAGGGSYPSIEQDPAARRRVFSG